jgi:hypothetical protein
MKGVLIVSLHASSHDRKRASGDSRKGSARHADRITIIVTTKIRSFYRVLFRHFAAESSAPRRQPANVPLVVSRWTERAGARQADARNHPVSNDLLASLRAWAHFWSRTR